MKFLILASILCFANADLMKRAESDVDDSVATFIHGSTRTKSLSEALWIKDKWLDEAGKDIQTELGKHLKEVLKERLEKIKKNAYHGKQVAQDLLDKVKEIREKLKDMDLEVASKSKELLQKIKAKAKEALQQVLDRLCLGIGNLDEQLDRVARSKVTVVIDKLMNRVTSEENLDKIRNYIKKIPSNIEIAQVLRTYVEKLPDRELRDLIRSLLDNSSKNLLDVNQGATWNKNKNTFENMKIKIDEHAKKFDAWVKEIWQNGMGKFRQKFRRINAISMEFVTNEKDVIVEAAREALEFFKLYKEDLGSLWNKLVEATEQAIGVF